MVVECLATFYNKEEEDRLGLGIEPDQIMLPIAFDMREVCVVNNYDGQARFYFKSNEVFVTDMDYNYALHLFKFVNGGKTNEDWIREAHDSWLEQFANDKNSKRT